MSMREAAATPLPPHPRLLLPPRPNPRPRRRPGLPIRSDRTRTSDTAANCVSTPQDRHPRCSLDKSPVPFFLALRCRRNISRKSSARKCDLGPLARAAQLLQLAFNLPAFLRIVHPHAQAILVGRNRFILSTVACQ